MSFPNIIFGSPGDQFTTGTTQTVEPVGSQLVLADGRKYRYALKSAAAAVAGDTQSSPAMVANHVAQTPVAAAVGALGVATALGASTTADQYRDGYFAVEVGTGGGYVYAIGTHGVIATGGTVPLREPVQVAIPATAASISLVSSTFRSVVVAPTTETGAIAGCAVKPIAASAFGWLQTKGIGSGVVVASTVAGENLSIITTAGALGPVAAGTTVVVGIAANTVVAAAAWGVVQFIIDA
jgi:hypothetical protein